MWELDYKESWALKNWCFWMVVLEKTPESPLDCKEIQPVHPKGDQFWTFFGRTDVEAETPNFGHVMWSTGSLEKTWCRQRLKTGRDRDNRGWDGCMASPTWWTWVRVSSRSWRWTGKPGVLQSMGLQRLTRLSDWTEVNWKMYATGYIMVENVGGILLEAFWEELPLHFSHHLLFQPNS